MTMVQARKQRSLLYGPRKKLRICLALGISIAALAGCDASSSGPPISRGGDVRTEKLKTNLSAEEMRDLAQPITDTPGLSVETAAAQNSAVGNEGYTTQLNPALGLNTRRLFDQAAANDDERFERLEAAVQSLRDDFDKISPAVNRLMAIEQEIQTLVDQLQVLVGENAAPGAEIPVPPVPVEMLEDSADAQPLPIAPPAPPAEDEEPQTIETPPPSVAATTPALPDPAPVPAPAPAPVQAAQGDETIREVRIADHASTTRIVFETSEKPAYTAEMDPEKILIVTFTQGTAAAALGAGKPASDIVKSVDVSPQGSGGVVVAMALAKSSSIVRQGVLPPDGRNPNYRLYIDIAR